MKVSNPLTIIATFAGLAETLACVALIKLPIEIQTIFVYFVMAFPSGIVILFFLVLYYKNTVLYAPGDFQDQSHYLEANNIKETVGVKIEEIFAELNKKGNHLTREEIESAKNRVEKTIDETAALPRKEQILEFLKNGPATTAQISNELKIHPSYVISIMKKLTEDGQVHRIRNSGAKYLEWTLST